MCEEATAAFCRCYVRRIGPTGGCATGKLNWAGMQLLFLTHEPFYPPSGGGSAEAVYLVRALVDRGWSVHVMGPDFEGRAALEREMGICVTPFRGWAMGRYARARNLKYLMYPWVLGWQARRVIRRHAASGKAFDGIIAQHTISAMAAGRVGRAEGIPVVLNYLDFLTGFMETWPGWIQRTGVVPVLKGWERRLPRHYGVAGVMTVSEPLADRLAASGYPRKNIRPIQYGYDAERFRPTSESEFESERLAQSPPVVVMHGSFDRHHLGPIAEAGLRRMHRELPEVRVRFIGCVTGTLSAFVDRLKRDCPGMVIELPGFVPYESVGKLLQTSTVGMVPYEASEGTHCAFVAKAVEYLGCGLPVVSTSLENLTRYFSDEPAIRFSAFDGESFGMALVSCLKSPAYERRRLGLAASVRVADALDWKVVTATAAAFIGSTLGSPKGEEDGRVGAATPAHDGERKEGGDGTA